VPKAARESVHQDAPQGVRYAVRSARTIRPMLAALLACALSACGQAQQEALPLAEATRMHSQVITHPREQFAITMGGMLDTDNTTTLEVQRRRIAFQPMQSVTIENVGDSTVRGIRVVANKRGDWYDFASIAAEATRGARSDQEKIQLIYQFMLENHHHGNALFCSTEDLKAWQHDPVLFLNSLPVGLCGYSAENGLALMRAALGPNADPLPVIRGLHGHTVGEVGLGGELQMIDMAARAFYLDRENRRPVSGDELARDHDLAKREVRGGPLYAKLWDAAQRAAAQFGADDVRVERDWERGAHRIDLTLRPGEALEWRWDSQGKFSTDGRFTEPPAVMSNSLFTWRPPLDNLGLRECAEQAIDLVPVEGGLAATSRDASATFRVRVPYFIAGGHVRAVAICVDPGDSCALELSLDGVSWTPLAQAEGAGRHVLTADMDDVLPIHEGPPEFEYLLSVRLGSARSRSARLTDLRIETVVMTSPMALPRLRVGENRIAYSDESVGARRVRLSWRWRESSAIEPPEAPAGEVYPSHGATVRDSMLSFRWPAVAGCDLYHLQVSRDPQMRIIYRPSFDCYHEATSFGIPFTGVFSPGEDYFWRVRARTASGVWGDWTAPMRFRWQGPRVPVNLRAEQQDGRIVITWAPNPEGPRPVRYRVYGSDERGFSVSDEPHDVAGLGECPANFVAETEDTRMTVVAPDANGPNPNRCFYRVVAVDAHGTRSGCSDYVELPHPLIVSAPATEARVGAPWSYEARSLRSLGDLQYRDGRPQEFFEREEITWTLVRGPAWLSIDPQTGLLGGTPTASGRAEVEIAATTSFPHDYLPEGFQRRAFEASRPQPRTATQAFTIEVR